jgi:hypothetical protein
MAQQLAGTMAKRMGQTQMLPTEDSAVKKAMSSVMKLGRKNRPKMPTMMKKAEGM